MSFDLTNRIRIVNPSSNIDELYGPFNSIIEANASVPIELRVIGRTLAIITDGTAREYWYEQGIEDTNLVPKSADNELKTLRFPIEKYKTTASIDDQPTFDPNLAEPIGWVDTVPIVGEGIAIWKIVAMVNGLNEIVEVWRGPILVNGIGSEGQSSFVSLIFKRSHTQPDTPTGGDYLNPVPEGWFDGVPPEEDGMPVYFSTRRLTDDGLTPQDPNWATPQKGVDTSSFDVEWSTQPYTSGNPGTPTNPLNGAVWTNTDVGAKYMATRTIDNGKSSAWTVMRTEGEKGADGKNAQSVFKSFVFIRSLEQPIKPSGGSFLAPIPSGWHDGIPEPLNGWPAWGSSRIYSSDGLEPQSDWVLPEIQVDTLTTDREWSDSILYPGTPTDPENGAVWYNDHTENAVWRAEADIVNGSKGDWRIDKIKGEKGEKGEDGADGFSYTLSSSNPMQSVSVGSNEVLDIAREYINNISVFRNTQELVPTTNAVLLANEYSVTLPTAIPTGITVVKLDSNSLKFTIAQGTSLPDNVTIPIEVKVGVNSFVLRTTFLIVPIATADDAESLSLVSSTVVAKYNGLGELIGPSSVTLEAILSNYSETVTWTTSPHQVAGLHGTTGISKAVTPANLFPTGSEDVKIRISTPNGLFDETTITKIKDGTDGEDGVNGQSILPSIIFKRSATAPTKPTGGSFASPVPEGWSDGVPAPDAEGNPVWMSTRKFTDNGLAPQDAAWSNPQLTIDTADVDFDWSDSELDPGTPDAPLNGATWNETSNPNSKWMAVQKKSNGTALPWEVFRVKGEKGENGLDGHSGYTLELSNDNTSVPANAQGQIVDPVRIFQNARTLATLYYGDTELPTTDFGLVLTASTGLTFTSNASKTDVQITALTEDTGTIEFVAHPKAGTVVNTTIVLAKATFSITKVNNTAVYEIIPSVTVVKVSSTGALIPAKISAAVIMNSGDTNGPVYDGNLTYRYLDNDNQYDNDDGTPISIGQELTLSNSGNWNAIEFKYFHPSTGELVDRETVGFVSDGVDGSDGVSATREETRFMKSASFTVPPTIEATNPSPAGWTVNPPTIISTESLWVSKSVKNKDGALVSNWSTPVRYSGPAGPKGEPGDSITGPKGDSFNIIPRGKYNGATIYKGSATSVEAVWYTDSWYVTRVDAGTIPIGTPPTSTLYWNKSQENYDFIATGLFLAETAYIENLGVRNLNTSVTGTRLEIKETDNSLKLFKGTNTSPSVNISTDPINVPFLNTAPTPTASISVGEGTHITSSGIIAGESGLPFDKMQAPVLDSYGRASFIGHYSGAPAAGKGYKHVGILATANAYNSTTFGVFAQSIAIGGSYLERKNSSLSSSQSTIIISGGTTSLPSFNLIDSGWNSDVLYTGIIINKSGTATVTTSTGTVLTTITGKGKVEVYWDGIEWTWFKIV